jgi:glycerophosphoryl diester phosphodiesterase
MSERPFSQGGTSGPLVVAHRGASAREAENTLEAFEAAIVAGAGAIELDVRLTADGVPVVLHDADLDRTTDASGPVGARSLAELRSVRIATRGGRTTQVPTFREVLDALSGRVPIDVELKNVPGEPDFEPGATRLVEATLQALGHAGPDGDVLVSSFDPVALDAVRRREPDLPTGLLLTPDVDALAGVTFARDRGHRWVLPSVAAVRRAGAELVPTARGASVRVGTWIADEPSEVVALFRSGIDAVATNDPEPVVAAVREAFGR